ncbi:cytochrome c [Piscinibacter terrae]|nr:cytochrome c [Albitalea terrae]
MSAQFEVDSDLMRNIEDTTKSLDSNVSLKDAKSAAAEAKELATLFAQVEDFYARKGDATDAVGFSRKTHDLAEQVIKAVDAGDYDTASTTVIALARSCKSCHEVYKK